MSVDLTDILLDYYFSQNDGEVAKKLSHPSHKIKKYIVFY